MYKRNRRDIKRYLFHKYIARSQKESMKIDVIFYQSKHYVPEVRTWKLVAIRIYNV